MNKELTPLQALENIEKEVEDFEGFNENTKHQMDRIRFQIIETELKESKKLKECYKNELKNVSYYNNLALKYKKIVDVIVVKEVDCNTLIFYLKQHNETGHIDYAFDSYNDYAKDSDKPQLTKEEFDFLKEVLL